MPHCNQLILSMQDLYLDLSEQLCILSFCRGLTRVCGQKSQAKWGLQEAPPRLTRPAAMARHSIRNTSWGVRGAEAGVQKIAPQTPVLAGDMAS
eukprot:1147146-Pelagomonas_calceolata.AAC.12